METHFARPWIDPAQIQRLNGGFALQPSAPVRLGRREQLLIWARLHTRTIERGIVVGSVLFTGLVALLAGLASAGRI